MAEVRVRMECADYGLSDAVIAVGWDSVMNYQRDKDFRNHRISVRGEMLIGCNALPKNEWDVDEPGNPWASFVLMDNGCYIFKVSVDIYCAGSWVEWWVGEFSTTEWRINLDKKYVIVKPKASEFSLVDWAIECLKKNWTATVNIYDIPELIEVKPYVNLYGFYEFQDTYTEGSGQSLQCFDHIEEVSATVPDYCFTEYHELYVSESSPVIVQCTFFYHRFEKNGTCEGGTPIPPDEFSDWFLIDGTCPTPLYWKCPDSDHLPVKFANGRLFRDMMQYLIDQSGCGMEVRSTFFNINPDTAAPDNSAYTAALANLQQLVVFQKSDIKRFDATNLSEKPSWTTNLKGVLDDLWIMFKVKARIEGDILRLEHVSFYEAQPGNDYTNEYYTRELQRDNIDTPRLTRFYFRDEKCSPYFAGVPIEIYCGEGEADLKMTQFYTDLLFAIESDNAEAVADEGWFLMATNLVGDTYRCIEDNRPLSFTELHANYHTYEMAGVGKINGEEVVPDSILRTRKQPPFSVKKCCDDEFDVERLITTRLGQGEIENADLNLSTNELTLTAKY